MSTEALIYKLPRSVMQAGLKNTKMWILEINNIHMAQQNLLVKTVSAVGSNNIKLFFTTKEQATDFAINNNINFSVQNVNNSIVLNKSYQDNILKNRNIYYFNS